MKRGKSLSLTLVIIILISIYPILAQVPSLDDWENQDLETKRQTWKNLNDFKEQKSLWESLKENNKHDNTQKQELLFQVLEEQVKRDEFLTNLVKENNPQLSDSFQIEGISSDLYEYQDGYIVSISIPERILPIEDTKIDPRAKKIKANIVTTNKKNNPGFRYNYENGNTVYADKGYINENGEIAGTHFADGIKIQIKNKKGSIYQIGRATEEKTKGKFGDKLHRWTKNPSTSTITDNRDGKTIKHTISEDSPKVEGFKYAALAKEKQANGAIGYDFSGILDNGEVKVEKPTPTIKNNKAIKTVFSDDPNFDFDKLSDNSERVKITRIKNNNGKDVVQVDANINNAKIDYSQASEEGKPKDFIIKANLKGHNVRFGSKNNKQGDIQSTERRLPNGETRTEVNVPTTNNEAPVPEPIDAGDFELVETDQGFETENGRVKTNLGGNRIKYSDDGISIDSLGYSGFQNSINELPKVRNPNTGVYEFDDVMSRLYQSELPNLQVSGVGHSISVTFASQDIATQTHEATHLLSDRTADSSSNSFYIGDGKSIKLKRPANFINGETIKPNIPTQLHNQEFSPRFETYFGDTSHTVYINGRPFREPKTAAFYTDEHVAYIAGGYAAIDAYNKGFWTINQQREHSDPMQGVIEFNAYQLAVARTIQQRDRTYANSPSWDNYKSFTKYNLEKGMETYRQGLNIPVFDNTKAIQFYNSFKKTDLIDYARHLYGDEWTNKVLLGK